MNNFKIFFNGQIKKDDWECFSWTFHLGSETFQYYTGLGHATKSTSHMGLKPKTLERKVIRSTDKRDNVIYVHIPKLHELLYSLALDASCGNETFEDFCGNCGYDTDSRKALNVYLQCQETNVRLRKVLKSKNAIERILAWEL